MTPVKWYGEFLLSKRQEGADTGFEPVWIPDFLYDYQASLAEWALRKGRAGVMAHPGLGKSPMAFVIAENIARKTGGKVLIVAPLAVSHSLLREAEKFGVEAKRSIDGTAHRITVTNYERLGMFNPRDFAGVIGDEAAILKNSAGVTTQAVIEFLRVVPYRFLLSGLLSPNDHHELGTASEALGYLGYTDMLGRFFSNSLGNIGTTRGYLGTSNKWRLRSHAKTPFYRWVCSWGRVARKPSDLGAFSDARFELPQLVEIDHFATARLLAAGRLFEVEAVSLEEQREEARRTVTERCEMAASIVSDKPNSVSWVNLNEEGALLRKLIPGAIEVTGSDSDEKKEETFLAFERGEIRHLITKPSIAAWGLNWQHCRHSMVFPTHSYEQYFQLIRRFWRFGQTEPVNIYRVSTDGGKRILDNLKRKGEQSDALFADLVRLMGDAMHLERRALEPRNWEVPSWLQ